MLLLSIFLFIFALLVFWFLVRPKWEQYTKLRAVIDTIPGPIALPLFGNALQLPLDPVRFSLKLEEWTMEFGRQFGAMRIWMGIQPMVVLTKADTAQEFLTSTTLIKKSNSYDQLKEWLGDGLLISNGNKWRQRRKMITPSFHFSILDSFLPVMHEKALILITKLNEKVDEDVTFDVYPHIGKASLDIICETAMGYNVEAQTKDSPYLRAVKKLTYIIMRYERSPWFWFKPFFYLFGDGFEFNKYIKIAQDFTRKVIADRKVIHLKESKSPIKGTDDMDFVKKRRLTFLDNLLEIQEENKLSDEDIREEVETFMFEGHDTTASGISWALFVLGTHADVQEKIYEEICDVVGNMENCPTNDQLKQMTYFRAVIKECMRLYPPVAFFAREVHQETVLGKITYPKGATVLIVPYVIYTDPDINGPDANKFDPERFLDGGKKTTHPFGFVPFSAGLRNCIGQRFALQETQMILANIIHHFLIHSVERLTSIRPVPDLVIRPSTTITLRLTRRK